MIPRLSSNDLQFWETMYSSGVPVASSRGGLGIRNYMVTDKSA
mgnify:FL=1